MNAIFSGLLLCSLLASCVVTEYDQYDETLNGQYILSELNGQPMGSERYKAEEPPALIFNSEDLQVSGSTGCNSFSGKLKSLDEQRVKFGNMVATKIACPGSLEVDFLAMLQKTNRYEFRHGKLIFYRDQEVLARFFERKAKPDAEE